MHEEINYRALIALAEENRGQFMALCETEEAAEQTMHAMRKLMGMSYNE